VPRLISSASEAGGGAAPTANAHHSNGAARAAHAGGIGSGVGARPLRCAPAPMFHVAHSTCILCWCGCADPTLRAGEVGALLLLGCRASM
jgi:hypothetical protein